MRKDLWDAMLDAEMSVHYWDETIRRYTRRDRGVRIFLAFLSSGAAGTLIFAYGTQTLARSLSALVAGVSIWLSVIDLQGDVRGMLELKRACGEFAVAYQALWLRHQSGTPESTLVDEFAEARERETERTTNEAKYPRDLKLLRRCQADVRHSRGLM